MTVHKSSEDGDSLASPFERKASGKQVFSARF
jgi:hypothetical protein